MPDVLGFHIIMMIMMIMIMMMMMMMIVMMKNCFSKMFKQQMALSLFLVGTTVTVFYTQFVASRF